MTLLVTGGAGFIGSHFIEHALASGEERLVCLDHFNEYYPSARKRANITGFAADRRVKIIEADFCDASAMQALFAEHAVERVMHLGGYPGVRFSIAHPLEYERSNVLGTLALLEAARLRSVERFVLVSSSTVYGRDARAPFVEDAALGTPLSPYGATKQAAEILARTYHLLHGLPVVCLRPFSVYGTRLRPDLALEIFAAAIEAGRPLPLFGDGLARRDFTHVSDICHGLLAALRLPAALGEAINLGHDQPLTIREVIATLERELGRQAIIDPQLAQPGEMSVTHADLTKARRLLGYAPTVDFATGVREYVAWRGSQPKEQRR